MEQVWSRCEVNGMDYTDIEVEKCRPNTHL